MGIVKISEQMHENLRLTSGALSRSINAQAEHWLRVGMLAELNPNLVVSKNTLADNHFRKNKQLFSR